MDKWLLDMRRKDVIFKMFLFHVKINVGLQHLKKIYFRSRLTKTIRKRQTFWNTVIVWMEAIIIIKI